MPGDPLRPNVPVPSPGQSSPGQPSPGQTDARQPNAREPGARPANRRQDLLDAAARLFARQGFHAASMRDIARAVGMLPGSLYYHIASKDELLLAVYAEGVRRIAERVDVAAQRAATPWARLEAACVAHCETLLDGGDYAQVVIRVRPEDCAAMEARLTALRDAHEDRFKALVAALDLPADADRQALRLMLLGALNWSQTWYRPGGDSPAAIARRFLALLACNPRGPGVEEAP